MDALTARKVKNFKQFEKNNIELYSKNNTKGEIGIQRQMVGRASRITPWSFNLQFLPHTLRTKRLHSPQRIWEQRSSFPKDVKAVSKYMFSLFSITC